MIWGLMIWGLYSSGFATYIGLELKLRVQDLGLRFNVECTVLEGYWFEFMTRQLFAAFSTFWRCIEAN